MEATTETPITENDQQRLVALEAAIDQGAAALRDMGNALLEIRDARLYRLTHSSFENYLRERFNFSRQYGYLLMQLATIAERCQPLVDIPLHSEQHARLLGRLPDEQQGPAWAAAVESAGGKVPTTAQLKTAIKATTSIVCPIAEKLAGEWSTTAEEVIRSGKFSEAVDLLTEVLGRHAKRRILNGTVGLTIDEVIALADKPVDDQRNWWFALPAEEFATKDDRLHAQIESIAIAIDDISDNVGGDAKAVLLDERNGLTPLEVLPIWCQEPARQRELIAELREKIAKNNAVVDSVDDEPALSDLMITAGNTLRSLIANFPEHHHAALGKRLIYAGQELIDRGTIR